MSKLPAELLQGGEGRVHGRHQPGHGAGRGRRVGRAGPPRAQARLRRDRPTHRGQGTRKSSVGADFAIQLTVKARGVIEGTKPMKNFCSGVIVF